MIIKLKSEEDAELLQWSDIHTDETRNIYDSLNLSEAENNNPAVIIEKLEEFARV